MPPLQETPNPEYRIAKGWRIFLYVLVPPMMLLFLALPFVMMSDKNPWIGAAVGFTAMGLGAALFMGYVLLDTIRGRFIIGPREVRKVGAFKTKTLALNEIQGFRVDDKYVTIYPRENYLPTLRTSNTTERFQEIVQWLASRYPDLNRVDVEQATAALLADEALGDTPEARARALVSAKRVALGLNIAGVAVGIWLLFYPKPYEWIVAGALLVPVLAAGALWLLPHTVRIDQKKNSGYPSVLAAVFAPGLVLLLRSLFDFEIVSHAALWPVVGKVAAGTALVLAIGSRNFLFKQGSTASVGLTVVVLAALYGCGATLAVNAVYDESPAKTFTPQVTGKHINTGKTTTYYLTLQAWGPVATEENAQVSSAYYQQVQPGQSVTVALRPGRLGVPWFRVMEE